MSLSEKINYHKNMYNPPLDSLSVKNIKVFIRKLNEEDLRVKNFIKNVVFKKDRDWNNKGEIISLILNEFEISKRKKEQEAGKEFKGSLTKVPDIDWYKEVEKLDIDDETKQRVKEKLNQSLARMQSKKE